MAGSLLLSVPQAHRIEADVVTCCSLINALERGGQWLLAEKLFLQMCTTQVMQRAAAAHIKAFIMNPL
jgi:pentatricopeptide repeat protein